MLFLIERLFSVIQDIGRISTKQLVGMQEIKNNLNSNSGGMMTKFKNGNKVEVSDHMEFLNSGDGHEATYIGQINDKHCVIVKNDGKPSIWKYCRYPQPEKSKKFEDLNIHELRDIYNKHVKK
jgi:hypothetical protein